MLANLDNEVYFKKVFTDVEVFCAFVKDILGIDMKITKVDTEKIIQQIVNPFKFRIDLHAKDKAQKIVVEIQKVDYDCASSYFLGNLIDMQRDSKSYKFAKDVYIIVIVAAAYHISNKDGKPTKDGLVTDINPNRLKGEIYDLFNHKIVILDTTNVTPDTPSNIRDWLDLIIESMKNPYHPKINTKKPAIKKAARLAEINNISPEQLAEAKIQEMRKATIALVEDRAKEEAKQKYEVALKKAEKAAEKKLKAIEQESEKQLKAAAAESEKQLKAAAEAEKKAKDTTILNALQSGALNKEQISTIFNVTIEYIEQIGNA